MSTTAYRWAGRWLFALAMLAGARGAAAQNITVTLKDGTTLGGAVEYGDSFVSVDDGLRVVWFGLRRLQDVRNEDPFRGQERFRIRQSFAGQSSAEGVSNLINILQVSPFDEDGRRTFTVRDPKRGQLDIVQAISDINPRYAKLQGVRYQWESSVATVTIPPDRVEALLRKSIDSKKLDQRLRVVMFLVQRDWLDRAETDLKRVAAEFPEAAETVQNATKLINERQARRLLEELTLRRRAGQHQAAFAQLRRDPPEAAPSEVLVAMRDMHTAYTRMLSQIEKVHERIETLSRAVMPAELQGKLASPLREIAEQVGPDSLPRLDAFLATADESKTPAADRLAMAVSGWLVGSPHATPNVDRALRLWEARQKIADYAVEPEETRRERLLAELRGLEGLSVELAARVIELMPPVITTPGIEPGRPFHVQVGGERGDPIEYDVLLPLECNIHHRYPVIISLHGQSTTPEKQLEWWAAQAIRQGYIVAAPAYTHGKTEYGYGAAEHLSVLRTLVDLRRRFPVDSDRVFLHGHSMGGDAAWDIGLAHPDLFAGVMPICGVPQKFCDFYSANAARVPFYIIEGEKDGQRPVQNRVQFDRFARLGYDALFVSYKGRGHEHFSDAIFDLFDWMGRKKRDRLPLDFACRTARPLDNEFYWVSVDDFLPEVLLDPKVFERNKLKSTARIEGKLSQNTNSVVLTVQGARQAELWLHPDMLDLSQRVQVRVNGRSLPRQFVAPDLAALLEDFRQRADRQKLFHAKLSIDRL
jgi:predicted esterase